MGAKFKKTLVALAVLIVTCRQVDPAWAAVDTPSTPHTAAPPPDEDDEEAVVVTATRAQALMKDEPIHVEAVPTEEIEENLTESPGNISTIFLELPGVHAESVAPGLGGAAVQLRGMPSRDTLVLMDGLPLLGAESDGFGILQTPPLDLARAEVIKGAASALYGASALGGVLNLVSRIPDSQSSLLASADSHGGQQVSGFATFPGTVWSGTLTGAIDNQSREDIDGDGWTDLAYHQRYTIRPRLWWQASQDQSLFLTAGFMDEDRRGGTMPGADLPDGEPFAESLRTRRFDMGAVSHWNLGSGSIDGHLSFTSTHQDSAFGTLYVAPTMITVYGEEAWSSRISQHHWVFGVAFEHDSLSAATVPGVGYSYNVPAVFAQDEFVARDWLTLAASTRVDFHNVYGTFVSPHFSALLHSHSPWSLRAAVAEGFSAPTPQLEEVESTSLAVLLPLRNLHAERATTTSLDLKWASNGWEVSTSVFRSEIRNPLEAVPIGSQFALTNDPGSRSIPGGELVLVYHQGPLETMASWTRVHATQQPAPGIPGTVPLVPRGTAQIGTILELKGRGRVGLEIEYTGPQSLDEDPYRGTSPGFTELNTLSEIRFGSIRVFVNALNLTNIRQTHWDPLIRPTPGPGGNPITDVWTSLTGRTFNVGLRAEL